jgi:serine/threonine protein kinase/phage tail protein X
MPTDPQLVRDRFLSAAELPVSERAAFLAAQCGDDPELRAAVERLLAAHEQPAGILNQPVLAGPDQTQALLSSEQPGAIIAGRYKLIEAIGEGGMGTVWVAEQKEPVKRRVAIKLVKAGMDSRQVLARFEAERQALALMDHPHIAKVFDGGVTEQGRPFFVMEYVKGVPLTEYCDQARLSLKDRLNLFVPVCQAVQHAHQKGIIHRDLKPSNILICLYDGQPVPKVIDFGLAKAMHQALTDQSLYTAHGMMVGTPLYMSPEQAEHNNLDVDTRTDIYSLGVILYELLTGTTPLERQQLKQAAYHEILRLIKEVEPPKPSTRLSGSGSLPSVAAQRSIEPRQLAKALAGDLDWIVMKALDKERSRRYETANGLARDVERYLHDEAVEACPPSRAYRLKKFIHRNRALVTAGSAVAAALLVGVAAFAYQAQVARDQRDQAVQARKAESEQRQLAHDERDRAVRAQRAEAEQRKLADAARAAAEAQEAEAKNQEAEARKQAAIAEAIARFQTDMLAAADPQKLLGDKVTVLQALEAAVQELDRGALQDQPLVEAGVRDTIGTTLQGLGRYDDAEPNLRKSLAIRRAALPAGHPDIAFGLNSLALLLQAQHKLAEAEPLYRESLQIRRAAHPAGHPDIATSLNNLAMLLKDQNKLTEAEPLYREALEILRAAHPAGHPDIAFGLNNLAVLLQAQNKLAEAEPLFRESLQIRRAALPAGHPNIATGLNNLAELLQAQNKLGEAEPLFREALQISRAALPAGHPDIAVSLNNLALLLVTQNKLAEAEPLCREALQIRRVALPVGHPDIARSLNNLASLLQAQNKLAEAEPLFREALQIRRAALPAGHPDIATGLNNLAGLLRNKNKLGEAEPLFREALEIWRAALPAGHPHIATSLSNLASLLQAQNKLAEAEPLFREALAIYRAALPAGHPKIAFGLNNLAALLWNQNKLAEAEPLFREALEINRAALPAGHPHIATGLNNLAMLLQAQNKLAEAEPLYREALEIWRAALPAGHPHIATSLNNLADLLAKQGKTDEAVPLLRELLESSRATSPKDSPELAGLLAACSQTLLTLKVWEEAEPLLRECLAIREKSQPEEWTTFNTQSMLGGVLLAQKKYADAEPLLLAGYEGMKTREKSIPSPAAISVPEALDRLIELCTATDKPDEVTKWQAERAKYPPAATTATENKEQE